MYQNSVGDEQNASHDPALPEEATVTKRRTDRRPPRRNPVFTGLALILAPALCLGLYWQINHRDRPAKQAQEPAVAEETVVLDASALAEIPRVHPPFTELTIFDGDGGDNPYDPLAASGPANAFDQINALEYEELEDQYSEKRWGYPVVIVDGTVRAALESPEAYEALKEQLMAPYSQPVAGGTPWKRSFVNRVEIYYQADARGVVSVEEALDLLAPLLDVRLREQLHTEQEIPFEVLRLQDDTLAEGEVRITSEGKNGMRQEVYEVVSINGVELERNLLGTRVISPPENRVEMVSASVAAPSANAASTMRANIEETTATASSLAPKNQFEDETDVATVDGSAAVSAAPNTLAPSDAQSGLLTRNEPPSQSALSQSSTQAYGSLQSQGEPQTSRAASQSLLSPEENSDTLVPAEVDQALIPEENSAGSLQPEGDTLTPNQTIAASLSPGNGSGGGSGSAVAPQKAEFLWPSSSFSTFNYPTPGSSWYGNGNIGAGRNYPGVDKRREDRVSDQGIHGPKAPVSFAYPVEAEITSYFGWRSNKDRMHYGIDFGAARGTPILASAQGTVTWYTRNTDKGEYGKVVEINHGDGFTTIYAHCKSVSVREGDNIKQGDVIGYVGSTGSATGAHLHFEIRHDGIPYNPLLGYLEP